jgi:hypothetical protein
MKKIILLFVLSITIISSRAQINTYHPFLDSNIVWLGLSWNTFGGSCTIYNDRDIYASGDTTIGSFVYHKLYKNSYTYSFCGPWASLYYFGEYYKSFREDTIAKKVYLFENGVDTLAYDFSLNVGDTLPETCLGGCFSVCYIESIDSVLVDNHFRKQFWISGGGGWLNFCSLIEGIGSSLGSFAPLCPPWAEGGEQLYCVRINNQVVWSSDPAGCYLLTNIDDEYKEVKASIFPNPFSLNATIGISKKLNNATLSIYNVLGQEIKSFTNISGNEINLNRDNLPNGVYFIRLMQDNISLFTEKIIISD